MTKDEAIYTLKNTAFLGWSEQAEKVSEAVQMAVEALKRETSGDAIDRQAGIRIASGYCHFTNVAKELEKLLPVQPEIVPCRDCKHWICHDRRCGYWNHGVKPLEWCCHAERKENR